MTAQLRPAQTPTVRVRVVPPDASRPTRWLHLPVGSGLRAFEMNNMLGWGGGWLVPGMLLLVRSGVPEVGDAVVVRVRDETGLRCLAWRAVLQGFLPCGAPAFVAMSDVEEVVGAVVEVRAPLAERRKKGGRR